MSGKVFVPGDPVFDAPMADGVPLAVREGARCEAEEPEHVRHAREAAISRARVEEAGKLGVDRPLRLADARELIGEDAVRKLYLAGFLIVDRLECFDRNGQLLALRKVDLPNVVSRFSGLSLEAVRELFRSPQPNPRRVTLGSVERVTEEMYRVDNETVSQLLSLAQSGSEEASIIRLGRVAGSNGCDLRVAIEIFERAGQSGNAAELRLLLPREMGS